MEFIDYAVFFFLENPIPANPSPNKAIETGSGTFATFSKRMLSIPPTVKLSPEVSKMLSRDIPDTSSQPTKSRPLPETEAIPNKLRDESKKDTSYEPEEKIPTSKPIREKEVSKSIVILETPALSVNELPIYLQPGPPLPVDASENVIPPKLNGPILGAAPNVEKSSTSSLPEKSPIPINPAWAGLKINKQTNKQTIFFILLSLTS
jgi:hypothetical protein